MRRTASHRGFGTVMTDHPGWLPAAAGRQRVFVMPDGGRWLVQVEGGDVAVQALTPGGRAPLHDVFACAEHASDVVPGLSAALSRLGRVARFRTTDLWEALAAAIIRQVIRAPQATRLYRRFCEVFGERVDLPGGGSYPLFPTAQVVLALDNEQYRTAGMAFKRRPLKAAAEAYLERGAAWCDLAPHTLAKELQTVPRVGPWTAHAAVADWSNTWSLYPYADLAVRTWARQAAPDYDWPHDEKSFGQLWKRQAGDHLSSMTLLILAWGETHGHTR